MKLNHNKIICIKLVHLLYFVTGVMMKIVVVNY